MDKKKEKKIIEIAEREVRKFVREWKKYPYLWDTEADIHGELYTRIKKALKTFDKPGIKGKYKKYMRKKARFEHIYCKPLTYVKGENYYPDIVIYGDYTFDIGDQRVNEPMLWVGEIKYKTQWGGDQSEENRKYDKRKLKRLLQQQKDPKIHAYCLNFTRYKNKKPKFKPIRIKSR